MKKTQKTKLMSLLLVLITLFSALFIPISAVEANISEYDIYRDVETGGLWLYKKDKTRSYIPTYYSII